MQFWKRSVDRSFDSSNDIFDEALRTCIADFHALQIPDGDQHVVAAGIPWFATMFGRDSIIAAYQSLLLNPRLACETLRVLARYQGKEFNDWRDEEPGKIPHEYRTGEMTRCESTIVPSGFRSYSLKNRTSSAGAPPPGVAAANVGAETVTSAVGLPITSRSAVSGWPVNSANDPGASDTGVLWSIAEVSV